LSSQAAIAIISSYGIQYLKGQPWFPFLKANAQKLNTMVTAIIAALAGLGVAITFNEGTLMVTGLTLANLGHIVSHFLEQWAFQHAAYQGLINRGGGPQPGAVKEEDHVAGIGDHGLDGRSSRQP